MLTIILLSVGLPLLAAAVYLTLRNRRPELVADVRGVALQTVIVIVVLLAIAGAVSGVLLTRGGQEVQQLDEDAVDQFARFTTQVDCEAAGGDWGGSPAACSAP